VVSFFASENVERSVVETTAYFANVVLAALIVLHLRVREDLLRAMNGSINHRGIETPVPPPPSLEFPVVERRLKGDRLVAPARPQEPPAQPSPSCWPISTAAIPACASA